MLGALSPPRDPDVEANDDALGWVERLSAIEFSSELLKSTFPLGVVASFKKLSFADGELPAGCCAAADDDGCCTDEPKGCDGDKFCTGGQHSMTSVLTSGGQGLLYVKPSAIAVDAPAAKMNCTSRNRLRNRFDRLWFLDRIFIFLDMMHFAVSCIHILVDATCDHFSDMKWPPIIRSVENKRQRTPLGTVDADILVLPGSESLTSVSVVSPLPCDPFNREEVVSFVEEAEFSIKDGGNSLVQVNCGVVSMKFHDEFVGWISL